MSELPVRGICPVLETPFQPDGRLDLDGFHSMLSHVLAQRVGSVMFPAFASEFSKLSDAERDLMVRELLSQTNPRQDVQAIISVSNASTYAAIEAATAAIESGADAVNLLPIFAVRPSPAAATRHIRDVVAAIAPVPVVVQYAPELTGIQIAADELCRIAGDHPNLCMVKVEAVPPGPVISQLATRPVPLPAVVGYAGIQMIDAHERGAVGVQPGSSFVEIYQRIWELLEAGSAPEARALHQRLLPYLTYWMSSVDLIVAAEKAISQRRGLIRSDHCRRPARELDEHESSAVDAFLVDFAAELNIK